LVELGLVLLSLVWSGLVWFGRIEFDLVWSIHRQTNKLNNYLILINLICEFVCGFCGQKFKKIKKIKNKQTSL